MDRLSESLREIRQGRKELEDFELSLGSVLESKDEIDSHDELRRSSHPRQQRGLRSESSSSSEGKEYGLERGGRDAGVRDRRRERDGEGGRKGRTVRPKEETRNGPWDSEWANSRHQDPYSPMSASLLSPVTFQTSTTSRAFDERTGAPEIQRRPLFSGRKYGMYEESLRDEESDRIAGLENRLHSRTGADIKNYLDKGRLDPLSSSVHFPPFMQSGPQRFDVGLERHYGEETQEEEGHSLPEVVDALEKRIEQSRISARRSQSVLHTTMDDSSANLSRISRLVGSTGRQSRVEATGAGPIATLRAPQASANTGVLSGGLGIVKTKENHPTQNIMQDGRDSFEFNDEKQAPADPMVESGLNSGQKMHLELSPGKVLDYSEVKVSEEVVSELSRANEELESLISSLSAKKKRRKPSDSSDLGSVGYPEGDVSEDSKQPPSVAARIPHDRPLSVSRKGTKLHSGPLKSVMYSPKVPSNLKPSLPAAGAERSASQVTRTLEMENKSLRMALKISMSEAKKLKKSKTSLVAEMKKMKLEVHKQLGQLEDLHKKLESKEGELAKVASLLAAADTKLERARGEREDIEQHFAKKLRSVEKLARQTVTDLKARLTEAHDLNADLQRRLGSATTEIEHHRSQNERLIEVAGKRAAALEVTKEAVAKHAEKLKTAQLLILEMERGLGKREVQQRTILKLQKAVKEKSREISLKNLEIEEQRQRTDAAQRQMEAMRRALFLLRDTSQKRYKEQKQEATAKAIESDYYWKKLARPPRQR